MKNNKTYLNKYVKVLDQNNNLIASGKCKTLKPELGDYTYISFDDKWFFGNVRCKFEEVNYIDTFVPDTLPEFLIWDYWRNNTRGTEVDVYRDFDYDEIDPPIKPYVDRLNNINIHISTATSCCGHEIKNWYIGIRFTDLSILSIFLELLNNFNDMLVLVSDHTYLQFENQVQLQLKPNDNIDDRKMIYLDKFIKRLERRFENYE